MKSITLSAAATAAIERLQHNCGTFEFYASTLSRLFNYIFDQSEEIGMDDTEAMHTLRALRYLKDDITQIAGKGGSPLEIRIEAASVAGEQSTESGLYEETAEKVEKAFIGLTVTDNQVDEVREMYDILIAARDLAGRIQFLIKEAITSAINSGEKCKWIISDLVDVNNEINIATTHLEMLTEPDPDTFEQKNNEEFNANDK